MTIKNILICANVEVYIEKLLNELTKNNIKYLYIKNNMELHFDKYILRFYTPKTILNTLNEILNDLNVFGNLEPYLLDNSIDFIVEEPKQYINQKKIINEENKRNNAIIKKQLKHSTKIHRHNKKPNNREYY